MPAKKTKKKLVRRRKPAAISGHMRGHVHEVTFNFESDVYVGEEHDIREANRRVDCDLTLRLFNVSQTAANLIQSALQDAPKTDNPGAFLRALAEQFVLVPQLPGKP